MDKAEKKQRKQQRVAEREARYNRQYAKNNRLVESGVVRTIQQAHNPAKLKKQSNPGQTRFIIARIIEGRNYVWGVYDRAGFNGRQLISIVEGTYQDAVQLLKSERTTSGNTFKGFKKMKQTV